ncbi:VanZ family protein [Agromyces larvae]|uniref:VanZ family protein n=1 Tax=Agromyces larvae TaxID=2929802 RepID=A0ABY4BUB5_9MICO|nr:VanZ family protein [Agromyces larvae]UOE42769.1 VanZ family protein [Agromyces larvae]
MHSPSSWVSRKLLTVALVVYVGGALAVLLVPTIGTAFGSVYSWFFNVVGWHWMRPSYLDVPANVLLFVPIGFLAVAWFERFWCGFAIAVALSVGAEFAQILLPARDANPRDILSNALGACLGAVLATVLLRRKTMSTARSE